MSKDIYCHRCGVHVATYESGSKIKIGATMLCEDCTAIRFGAELILNDSLVQSEYKDDKMKMKLQNFYNKINKTIERMLK